MVKPTLILYVFLTFGQIVQRFWFIKPKPNRPKKTSNRHEQHITNNISDRINKEKVHAKKLFVNVHFGKQLKIIHLVETENHTWESQHICLSFALNSLVLTTIVR